MVTTINNAKGKRGEKGWYYKVNGESPGVIAINKMVNPGDTITWIYKNDICSATVDSCHTK